MTFEMLTRHLRAHGQEHVLRFWNELAPAQQQALQEQLAEIDLAQLAALVRSHEATGESPAEQALRARPPAELVRAARPGEPLPSAWVAARKSGEDLLRSGRVGAILVAGGEGTRLGFPHPKGQFPIGAASGKTLFQLF